MEVLYHIRPYFWGILPYIGLTYLIYGRYFQFRFLRWSVNIDNNMNIYFIWLQPWLSLNYLHQLRSSILCDYHLKMTKHSLEVLGYLRKSVAKVHKPGKNDIKAETKWGLCGDFMCMVMIHVILRWNNVLFIRFYVDLMWFYDDLLWFSHAS